MPNGNETVQFAIMFRENSQPFLSLDSISVRFRRFPKSHRQGPPAGAIRHPPSATRHPEKHPDSGREPSYSCHRLCIAIHSRLSALSAEDVPSRPSTQTQTQISNNDPGPSIHTHSQLHQSPPLLPFASNGHPPRPTPLC